MHGYEIRKKRGITCWPFFIRALTGLNASMSYRLSTPSGECIASVILDLCRLRLFIVSERYPIGSKRYQQPPSEDG